tara:strand:+ start:1327 stop:5526 length:4200 start_codon:yes stop_codon:yes gene_type:complete
MGIVFGQDNQFRAAKVPTAVTPYQGVETVPVINVAPKSSALDHFYAFEQNFQRTFDVFSKAIENKGYSVLDELETKKNQDIVDGFTTEQVAARNLERYKDVASKGVIPTRTEAHKEFAKRHASATGLNVDAIASARAEEFKEYVRDNPTDEGGIRNRYDILEQEWEGGQVWERLEGEIRPIIDTINKNNQSRSLLAAQERLKIGVQERIEDQLDAAPGTPAYLEGLRQLFGDTNVMPDSDGNYDLRAIGGSFYEVFVAPAIEEMNESGALDSWTSNALMDTLDEALVPIVQEAQKIIQIADRAAINAQRLESKTLSLQAAIDSGKDISAEAGSLLSEMPQLDSRGKFIPWSDRFASLVKSELDKPHLTDIPKTEGRTLEEAEVNRIDRLNRYHALTTIVPEDITTFMEDYGDVALRSVSPTYSEFVAAGLDKDTDSDIFQDILPDINREYNEFRQGALDQVKTKLAAPVLTTVESLLDASEGKNRGNPKALQRYFNENIAPVLMDYFPEEMGTINGLFNYDDNGNFIYRKYGVTDQLGRNVDIGFNLWQSTENPTERQPTIHDWQLDFRDGEYVVYPGINNQDGSFINLDEIITGDMAAQIDSGIFRFNSLEEAQATLDQLQQRESDIVVQARANTLETEPNRIATALSIKGEMPLLNPLEQSILKLMTSHDESLLRGMSSSSVAEPGDFLKTLDESLDNKTIDVTAAGIGKDSGRPSVQALRLFRSTFQAPGGEITSQWFDDVSRSMTAILPIAPQAFEAVKNEYERNKLSFQTTYAKNPQVLQEKIEELDDQIMTHLQGIIAAGAFNLEYNQARQAVEAGTGKSNALSLLRNPESQSLALKDILDNLVAEEDPTLVFDEKGNIRNQALFTSDKAITFIQAALTELNLQQDDPDVVFEFFGEYEDMVRSTIISIPETGATFVRNGVTDVIYKEQNMQAQTRGRQFAIGQAATGEANIATVIDTTLSDAILSPSGMNFAPLLRLQTDVQNLRSPFMQATIAFIANPGLSVEDQPEQFKDITTALNTRNKEDRLRDFRELFTGDNFVALANYFQARGINPSIVGDIANQTSETHQAFDSEFQRQVRIELGNNVEEINALMGSTEGSQELQLQQLYYGILQDAHSKALDNTFDPENGQFIFINEENGIPKTFKRSELSSDRAEELNHAKKSFAAIDQILEDTLQSESYEKISESRHAAPIVESKLGKIVDGIGSEDNTNPTTTLTHALSMLIPDDLQARQDRAVRIRMLLEDRLDENLAREFGVFEHFEFFDEFREQGNTEGSSFALNNLIRNIAVKDLMFLFERTTASLGEDPSLYYSPYKNRINFKFRINGENGNLALIVNTQTTDPVMGGSVQPAFPFYFPRNQAGKLIPVRDWLNSYETKKEQQQRIMSDAPFSLES